MKTPTNPQREIAIIWCVEDVLQVRRDLTVDQAWEVLQAVKEDHDADLGVSWTTLSVMAEEMFPIDGEQP